MLYILKLILRFSYFLYRIFYWNTNLPKVKKVFKNVCYGEGKLNKLDVIIPEGDGIFPVIIYIHGGGFISSDKKNFTRICRYYAENGFVVFNVNYRLVPEYKYPAQLQDITDAIGWIKNNCRAYEGDISKVFLAGDSSGAYLASWYACANNNERLVSDVGIANFTRLESIAGIVLFYGAYDIETVMKGNFPLKDKIIPAYLGKYFDDPKTLETASPARFVTNKFPRAFLCCSENDPLFKETKNLYNKIRDANVYAQKLFFSKGEYREAGHGFLNFYKEEYSKIAFEKSLKFIKYLINLT